MISVIIPTRNRAVMLAEALESLFHQDLDKNEFEVLVIDNGSKDQTTEVLDQYRDKIINFHTFYESEPGLHVGRHLGLKEARGEVLVFIDDDIEANKSWLSSIATAFSDSDVVLAGGNNLPLFIEPPPEWLLKMWRRSNGKSYKAITELSVIEFDYTSCSEISPYLVWGCNFAIRKNILLKAGGFHPDGMPKDLLMYRGDGETHISRYIADNRLKCIFIPGATIKHKVTPERMSVDYFKRRGFSEGISHSYTLLRNKGLYKRSGVVDLIRKSLSVVKRLFREWKLDTEVSRVLAIYRLGFKEGFNFHQQAYMESNEIRSWVHKATYIEEEPDND